MHHVLISFFNFLIPSSTQVVHQQLTIDEALAATKNPCSKGHLYRLVKQERATAAATAREGTRSFLQNQPDVITIGGQSDNSTMSSLTPSPQKNSRQKKAGKKKHTISTAIAQGTLMGVRDHLETQRRNNLKNNKSGSKRLASDKDNESKSKRPKRTPKQVNYDIKLAKANKADSDSKYKEALKEGTQMYADGQDPTSEVKKISLRGVCDLMNSKHNLDVEARRGIWTTYPNINMWLSG